ELQRLRSGWSAEDSLHRLVLLEKIFRLRDFVDDPASIRRTFAELAQPKQGSDDLVRSEAHAYLSDISALEGHTPQPAALRWYEREEQRQRVFSEVQSASGAEGLALRADLEHIAGMADAAGHMRQAAAMSPSVERWAKAAAFTDDAAAKFAALQAGLALSPGHTGMSLQLAVYYVGRQQLEKARNILQTALTAAPDNFVVAEHVAELYLNLGLRSAALREMRVLDQRSPAPLWLQARLALDYEQVG